MSETDQGHGAAAQAARGSLRGDAGTERAMVVIGALLVALAGFFLFSGTMAIPLNGRDLSWFAGDDTLRRLVSAPEAFDRAPHAPLTLLSLAFNWQLGGAAALHAGSLLLHALAAVLAYLCARLLAPQGTPEPITMLAGLFVAIGPVASGALDAVSARAGMQATAFALLALYVYLNYTRDGRELPWGAVAACAAAYGAAFASHFGALGLPLVLIAADLSRGGAAQVKRNAGGHLTLLFFLLAFAVARSASGIGGAEYPSGLWEVLRRQAIYAVNTVLGIVNVSPLPIDAADAPVDWSAALCFLGLILLALREKRRRCGSGIGYCWALVMAMAMPCVTPGPELLARGNPYLLFTGLAIAFPLAIVERTRPVARTCSAVFSVTVIMAGAVLNYMETAAWLDPGTRWQAEAERTGDARAWQYAAEFQLASGDPADAQARALPALQTWREKAPGDARAAGLLGGALLAAGKPDEALPVLLEALRLDPWNGAAAARLGAVHEQRARTGDRGALIAARDHYARAEALGALGKADAEAYAMVLAGLGDLGGAARVLKPLAGAGDTGPVAAAVKRFEAGEQQIRAREQQARAALGTVSAGDLSALVARAEAEFLRGRYMQAFYLLERLVKRDGANTAAWSLLGLVRARMGAADAFLNEHGALPAATGAGWEELARRCAASNLWDAALIYLRKSPDGNAELRLATMAQELGQPQRIEALLQQAAEAAPADPLPWLRLCEFTLKAKDLARANAALAEAQKRGASEEALKPLRDQLGAPAVPGAAPVQTIVN